MRLKCEYRFDFQYDKPRHRYLCIGGAGVIAFNVRELNLDANAEPEEKYTGGVEFYSRTPFEHSPHDAPIGHVDFVGGQAWHEGSSLLAEERFIPAWTRDQNDHEFIFQLLTDQYMQVFGTEEARV